MGRFVWTQISPLLLETLPAHVLNLLSVFAYCFALLPLTYYFLVYGF